MRVLVAAILTLFTSVNIFAQSGYVQEGKASFYADKFEGRTTASGERYSHAKSTCAHLTLPFGTLVRVTRISNGETIVVRVNDRGPFVPNRIIDLSRSAAEKLGFIGEGVTDVRIEVLDDEGNVLPQTPPTRPKENPETKNPRPTTQPQHFDKPNAAPQHIDKLSAAPQPQPQPSVPSDYELYELNITKQQPGGFTVQIKSYREMENLLRIVDELKSSLKENVRVQVATVNGDRVYRLMVGNYASRIEAEKSRDRIAKSYPDCFVVELK